MWNVSTANERRDMDASQIPQDILDVMHNPGVYYCDMPGMGEAQTAQLEILYDFNATRPREVSRRRELLEQRRPLKRAIRLPKRRHDSQMKRH